MTPLGESAEPGYAPTMHECLAKAGVPRRYERAAIEAVRDWIGSWAGLPEAPETLLDTLLHERREFQ